MLGLAIHEGDSNQVFLEGDGVGIHTAHRRSRIVQGLEVGVEG